MNVVLPKPLSELVRSFHVGIRVPLSNKYLWILSVTAHATRLMLCICGILGKGTLRTHPPSRVPTHPFRVLGLVARGKNLGEFSMCK